MRAGREEPMVKYNVWENKESKELALRPESTELSTVYWTILLSFEAEDRAEANQTFREMGGEP
jgi:hypothetical protein